MVSLQKTNIVAGTSHSRILCGSLIWKNYVIVKRLAPSIPGFTITGINGLHASHNREHYAILKLSGVSGRVLPRLIF